MAHAVGIENVEEVRALVLDMVSILIEYTLGYRGLAHRRGIDRVLRDIRTAIRGRHRLVL